MVGDIGVGISHGLLVHVEAEIDLRQQHTADGLVWIQPRTPDLRDILQGPGKRLQRNRLWL